VVAVAAQYFHALALTADGKVVGWGMDYANSANSPTGLQDVVGIAAGAYHNVALKSDGTIVVWGDNTRSDGPEG
jgi:alpha-tubulin suppressor-like RCC1 family protein